MACAGAAVVVTAVPAAAQGSYSPYNETPAAALARYVRTLASSPSNFEALIGAGRSALALGDTQAAAGFFARADEVNPRSPLPHAGMGAVSVADGEPQVALSYFNRAVQLGGTPTTFGCDRGLAYDLLGQQAQAQADYRAALTGPDAEEASRRLALSLAISGNKDAALQALAPLTAKRDPGAARARAFVLALAGDSSGAMVAIDQAMPGSWARVAPFLQRLPMLQAAQKAAVVNLGIFPDSSDTAYAHSAPTASRPTAPLTLSINANGDPIAPVADYARAPPPPVVKTFAAPAPTQVAYAAPPKPRHELAQTAAPVRPHKIWLQLASGPNAEALPGQFKRIKSKNRHLFDGISGYVAKGPDRARLVIGPFRSAGDAETFAEDLETLNVNAFKWSNSESDTIVPLGTE